MYEAVPAEVVGAGTSLGLRKTFGRRARRRHAAQPRARLAPAGVEPTSELAHRVTDEVKRLREERAASSKSEETIELYEVAMRRLSLTEEDVVDIAIALGSPRPAVAS